MTILLQPARRRLLLAALGAPLLLRVRGLGACEPGATNLLGPAYRKGAPFRAALCDAAAPGTHLRMSGTVTAGDTCKGLANAVLDVWQVDAAADYDMDSAAFRMRGRIRADGSGGYAFDSIVPPAYGRRAQHIHYLVTCPGYEPHITQSYFAGDERLKQDALVKAPLVVTLRDDGKRKQGEFNIALERERPADAAAMAAWPEYAGVYQVAPQVTLTIAPRGKELRWKLSPVEQDGDPAEGVLHARAANRYFCAEYDLMNTFVRDEHGRVSHILCSDGSLLKKV